MKLSRQGFHREKHSFFLEIHVSLGQYIYLIYNMILYSRVTVLILLFVGERDYDETLFNNCVERVYIDDHNVPRVR